ncbi:glycerol-3-phosphate responsive antiterminator [Anaerococcus sp. AGMB09787]|uniref:glycerol-3-phosphate responsive antiterminator n=1 Tax=Anaerococcus sp. AGMB09787 TaxID=2922869 RepID=UPI001FB01656|nr:glycerol-3-phosphate responsive antiterminator [Anaerococcus sp. AGMB09787]
MIRDEIFDEFYQNPVIMAIKDNRDLIRALEEENKIVFILYGNIETIPHIVKKIKDKNKIAIVHEDLIEGLSSSYMANYFIKKYTDADGIITTRPQNALDASKLGLFCILRFFIFDSISYQSMKETLKKVSCDCIEILPGIMPKITKDVAKRTSIPIVAGGLIKDKEDVINNLNAGAIAISSSNYEVWKM